MSQEYWFCLIGPVDRRIVPYGGDAPLRMSVKDKFQKMFPYNDYTCSSGWGMDQEEYNEIQEVINKHFQKRMSK